MENKKKQFPMAWQLGVCPRPLFFGLLVVILVIVGVAFLYAGVTVVKQSTLTARYSLLRTEANEDASPIDVSSSEGDFASKPAAAILMPTYQQSSEANAVEIIIAGASADGDTFSWKLWAWRHGNGPAALICEGTGVIGTQDVVNYPDSGATATSRWYADTLTITTAGFPKAWTVADAGGSGRAAKLFGDLYGYSWVFMEITNADGTGVEAESVSVYYAYL